MAKAKKTKTQTQAERFLEIARKARAGKSADTFARDAGKATIAQQARRPSKMGKP